jgi:hypothetical protein
MALRDRAAARLRRASRGRSGALALVGLVAFYAAAALLATLSALGSFGSHFIVADAPSGEGEAAAGDHLQTVYRFWLVGHQLERLAAPWKDPYSFQPLVEPQTSLLGWPFGLPFWPAEAAFGPVVAWNLLLLATIVAAGLLTFAWLRALALPWAPAALGGLVFAIAPYRLEQTGGHLLGWISLFLPLALLAIERSRVAGSERAAHAWGAVAALSLVTLPLSGQLHLALGAVPLVLAYAAIRYRPVAAAWCAGGALAVVVLGVLIRYTVIAGSAEGGGRSLAEVGEYSAEWTDFLSRTVLGGMEEFVFLGWLTPVLALGGLVFLWRRSRALAILLGIVAVVPVLLAFGTNLPLYSPLWHAFPPLQFPRVPERLLPVADLALAALVAFAAAGLAARARGFAAAVSVGLLVLVTADLAVQPFEAAAADPGNAAYRALANAPPGRVLELPLVEPGVHFGSVYDYYALQAPRERLSGYSTIAPKRAVDFYFRMNRLSCGVWLPGDREEIDRLGVREVVFHRGVYRQHYRPGAWFAWRGLQEQGYRPAAGDDTIRFFSSNGEIAPPPVPEPPASRPVLCEGWRGRAMVERAASFWINGGGNLELHVESPGRVVLRIWIDGRPAGEIDIAGKTVFTLPIGASGWHSVALAVPRLFPTKPPSALRLDDVRVNEGA